MPFKICKKESVWLYSLVELSDHKKFVNLYPYLIGDKRMAEKNPEKWSKPDPSGLEDKEYEIYFDFKYFFTNILHIFII